MVAPNLLMNGTPMARPEVLLFDLGGVLVDNATFDELPTLLREPVDDEELRRRWLFSPSVQAYERGAISTDEFATAFVAEWRIDLAPADFLARFECWPRGPFPGALELLERTRETYRLALLSNCNAVHWERLAPFRDRVHAAYSSHDLGLVKPDPAIFARVVEALQVDPQAICFFDDSPPNVEAARALGMTAYCTRGLAELEHALESLAQTADAANVQVHC